MSKTKFDIDCENFDLYFASQLPSISQPAKEGLPKDVRYKIFHGGDGNPKNTSKLGFFSKLYILWRCLRKRWWLIIEDEETGLSIEQFFELKAAIKKRDMGVPRAEGLTSVGTFVTGSKELCETMNYLNQLSASGAYNYLLRGKNKLPNKTAEFRRQMNYIIRFLAGYEAAKKQFVEDFELRMPEFLVLFYTYNGKEVLGSIMYNEFYKRAYQSSPTKIKLAFSTLQQKGYLKKTGDGRGAKLSITPLGVEIVNRLLDKYIVI